MRIKKIRKNSANRVLPMDLSKPSSFREMNTMKRKSHTFVEK